MSILKAFLSGALQGLTEFLPVSSSGHLAILHKYFGFQEPPFLFDIFLHIGTLLAVVIFFGRDILDIFKKRRRWIGLIVAGCIPTAIIGVFFYGTFRNLFGSLRGVGVMLIITGLWIATPYLPIFRKRESSDLRLPQALLVGLAQGIAIAPGISRSGATISTGLISGVEKETAVRFSFLLSLPAILGALVFELIKSPEAAVSISTALLPLLAGMLAALIVGILCIRFLLAVVRRGKLYYFSPYCIILGIISIIASF